MSLRTRLIAALIVLAAAGLVTLAAVTYAEQRSFLLDRVDQQARDAQRAVNFELVGPDGGPGMPGAGLRLAPPPILSGGGPRPPAMASRRRPRPAARRGRKRSARPAARHGRAAARPAWPGDPVHVGAVV